MRLGQADVRLLRSLLQWDRARVAAIPGGALIGQRLLARHARAEEALEDDPQDWSAETREDFQALIEVHGDMELYEPGERPLVVEHGAGPLRRVPQKPAEVIAAGFAGLKSVAAKIGVLDRLAEAGSDGWRLAVAKG